jgi:hypothetical protein
VARSEKLDGVVGHPQFQIHSGCSISHHSQFLENLCSQVETCQTLDGDAEFDYAKFVGLTLGFQIQIVDDRDYSIAISEYGLEDIAFTILE